MRKLLQLFFFLLISTQVLAWWETPHMLVAQIAYEDMTPEARKRADELIALHAKKYPNSADFVTASVWADDLRAEGNTTYSAWHYVTLLFKDVNEPLPTRANFSDRDNVAWAVELETRILKSNETTENEKALALRRLLHWVGDMHQPLHATSHVSPNYPKGDSGGNLFVVNLPKPFNNLHSYWDSGLGHWEDIDRPLTPEGKIALKKEVNRLRENYQWSSLGSEDPYQWAIESHELARKYAYTGLDYKGVPSAAYIAQGHKVTDSQVMLAGQRLAQLLNTLFRSSQ
jgi:hypothetical protein